ncbi:putative tricarboxylic transport membrane protein [Dethiosulfatibacter aminovorans DSM 17477]|uniref:Putative tricarboxylic transport membrane protein n=1 Tax=Dethiosulfatibacter aminovorans DSM 17477 TaxID=1121476 RepID=A0A1M6GNX6_9FIRM|nr:tripartite tricarboxylate transporter permease [Dethiosulfatibacter aminovorans]SHJ11681.1 putative tricarboxylic transport membrane protein [Dethiosulfatibacter aminovorans DSM 17477]
MNEILINLAAGFGDIMTVSNIFWITFGGFLGTIIGMLPGLGPATGVAILIPLTFGMDPTTALATMVSIYFGAMFGGSRASILLNTPGDGGAIAATFDGYPMAKDGRAGEALAISAIASIIGGLIAVVFLTLLSQPISKLAIKFGPQQYTMLMAFALIATSTISRGNMLKGLFATFIGLMVSTIGADYLTGTTRFTMGIPELYQGIDFLVLIIGFYAIGEVYNNFDKLLYVKENEKTASEIKVNKVALTKGEFKECILPIIRSTPLGFLIGVLPGAGATIATMVAYSTEKKLHKDPDSFGKGNIIGLAVPEAANNAAATGAIIPMLTLGIPGSGTTAVMIGALMMIGVKPGPLFFTTQGHIAWAVVASMFISNLILLFINLPLATQLVKVLKTPPKILLPCVITLGFIGTYSLTYSILDFGIIVGFGLLGYFVKKLDIPVATFILALILGVKLETSFRQAMLIGKGDFGIFASDPITIFFIAATIISIAGPRLSAALSLKKKSNKPMKKAS